MTRAEDAGAVKKEDLDLDYPGLGTYGACAPAHMDDLAFWHIILG